MSYLGKGPGKIFMPPPGGSINWSQLDPATQLQLQTMFSNRNRVTGGCCRIAQRPAIAVTTVNSGSYGGPDHFQVYNIGTAAGQFTQKAATINFNNIVRPAIQHNVDTPIVNFTGAGNLWGGFTSRIEGFDCFDLMGKTTSLSFIYFTNVTGLRSIAVLVANYSLVSTFNAVSGVPQYVSLSLPAIPLDAGIPTSSVSGISIIIDRINTGGGQTTSNLNVWQSGVFVNAPGQVNWGAAGGNWNLLAELQFEPGSVATPFERRPFSVEYAMLRRYYQTVLGSARFNATSSNMIFNTPFYFDPMRITPAVTMGAETGVNIIVANTLASALDARSGRFEIVSNAVGDCYLLGRTIMLNAEY